MFWSNILILKSLSVLIDENLTCENHVDTIVHYIKENCVNPSIIVCPLPPYMLSITTANHILTTAVCYRVAHASIGYWAQPPPIGHYREYPPPCPKGQLPKIIAWFRDIHQHTNSRGHREYTLTFRRITLILCYQVVTSSVSW